MATKELKELVAFGLACGELVASLSNGVGFDDVKKAVGAAVKAGPAFKGAGEALKEYVAMTDEEAEELECFVVQEFDICNDSLEDAIEKALKVAINLHDLVAYLVPKS